MNRRLSNSLGFTGRRGCLRIERFVPMLFAFALLAGAVHGSPQNENEAANDGPVFTITGIELQYVRENPDHPSTASLLETEVPLGLADSGYVAPRENADPVSVRLNEIPDLPTHRFHASALQRILEALRDELIDRGLMGIFVAPDPSQIDETGRDLRSPGDTTLRLLITTGIVTEMRTLASGDRINPEERVNHPLHRPLLERSPIQLNDGEEPTPEELLRKDRLDAFLFFLSRHPGRRVDAAVGGALEPGTVSLDYLVTENRPLVFYGQVSNTGTEQTDRLRYRFGLIHNQLTNNDDIFNLDYSTAGFDESHAVSASYEAPFGDNHRLRWRAYGGWNEFNASELGFFLARFQGESWNAGGEIAANIHQDRELFVDLVGGARFENIQVENRLFGVTVSEGEEDFFIPYVGLRLDRQTAWFNTQGSLFLEFQQGSVTGLDDGELAQLGRTAPDEDWEVLRWNVQHSFFLEPLFDYEAWSDPSTPESSTLVHEVAASFRGQYAFGNRLIPQQEQVIGGLYTVRGYPESVVAGDTAMIGSLEYRYHLPRAFGIEPEPRELLGQAFRWAPQQIYGRPDWDLVLKGFVDIGRTYISDRFAFESEETLIGLGVGAELLIKRNVNLRVDWGFAMDGIDNRVHSGSNRVHFVATIVF